jgi:class 3 adenylate cyclase
MALSPDRLPRRPQSPCPRHTLELVLAEVERFLTGTHTPPEPERVLATVMFTDIVGSTAAASRLGDRAWRELLARHDDLSRAQLERHRGRAVKSLGDGFLATFDGPARAIRCALALRDEVRELGIELRAGLHTGECEAIGDDVGGIAVHIGARVGALAEPREVLVSGTVKDLVVGSGIDFSDRGEHALAVSDDDQVVLALQLDVVRTRDVLNRISREKRARRSKNAATRGSAHRCSTCCSDGGT